MGLIRGPEPVQPIPAPCPSIDASPQKRLSTRTMHFKWHHRNLSNQSECDSAVYTAASRVAIWVFRFFTTKKCPKNQFFSGSPDGTWSVQLFLPGPWRFLLGPAPVGPTLVTGPVLTTAPWPNGPASSFRPCWVGATDNEATPGRRMEVNFLRFNKYHISQ